MSQSDVAYADVEDARTHAMASATVPWAEAHRAQRPEGWQLFVELVQADAAYDDPRLKVVLSVRATLRTRLGRTYLAQTNAHCQQAGLVPPEQGAQARTRAWRDSVAILQDG